MLVLALLFLAVLALGARLWEPEAPVPGLRAEFDARQGFNSSYW
jgi:hypothetical protein